MVCGCATPFPHPTWFLSATNDSSGHAPRTWRTRSLALVPERHRYRVRSSLEKLAFNLNPPVGDLPEIFHYWSNVHLRPRLEQVGFSSPEDFFFKSLRGRIGNQTAPTRVLSIGSGRCELEISLARQLLDNGHDQFVIVCMDINPEMLLQGKAGATAADIAKRIEFRAADVKTLSCDERFDVVLANQCLHHIVELETLFDTIASLISDGGFFLTSDVIGRNGHQLWHEGTLTRFGITGNACRKNISSTMRAVSRHLLTSTTTTQKLDSRVFAPKMSCD